MDLFTLGLGGLDEVVREGRFGPRKVARLLLAQPGGAQVWQEIGGWRALPDEVVALEQVRFTLVAINSEKAPKPPTPPVGRIEERRRKAETARKFVKGAERFKKALDEGMREEMERRLKAWPASWKKGTQGAELNARNAARMASWAERGAP